MSTDEIRELLLDLQGLALETEQAEQAILRCGFHGHLATHSMSI